MAPVSRHYYTISLPVGEQNRASLDISATTVARSVVPKCGLTVDELSSIYNGPGMQFIPLGAHGDSAVLIIRNGVNFIMDNSTDAVLLGQMDRLMSDFCPFMSAVDGESTFSIGTRNLPVESISTLLDFHGVLKEVFPLFNSFVGGVAFPSALIQCHLGRSMMLKVGGCNIELQNGDLYLVSGLASSFIAPQ